MLPVPEMLPPPDAEKVYGEVPPEAEKVVVPPAPTWALAGEIVSGIGARLTVMEAKAELEALSRTVTVADPAEDGV